MKTKKFLSMAALAMVGAMMTGCSNDDNFQQPENKSNLVTLTTTIGLDDGGTTRALTSGGVKTFAADETMAIVYKNTNGNTVKAVSTALAAGDITNGGKNATFTFTLDNPDKSQNVTYIYPAAMAKADGSVNYDALATQDGTLGTLSSNLDLATLSGPWNAGALPSGTLANQLAILAITLKDNAATPAEITDGITGMTINDGINDYAVTRVAADGPIYVAIRPTSSATINITATDGSNNYAKTLATTKTYVAGNGYSVSWRMAKQYPMAASATADDKGKLICTDGHIHAYGQDAECTAGRVAKIVYIGTTGHATYTHGLALALTDEGEMSWSDACTACSTTKNTSTPVTDATWLLASKDEWQKMAGAVGGYNNLGLTGDYYWSSTEYDANYAWLFNSGVDDWNYYSKGGGLQVRACLAF